MSSTLCSIPEITLASDNCVSTVTVPLLLWRRVLLELRARGQGRRESGAFLLGNRHANSGRVTRFVCYDDLDPCAYQSGAITFHAAGYAALWAFCRQSNLQVLADVHTHPGTWVQQSGTDQRNPMVPVVGHTAVIVPIFGAAPWWTMKAAGVYQYLGDFTWRSSSISDRPQRFRLSLW